METHESLEAESTQALYNKAQIYLAEYMVRTGIIKDMAEFVSSGLAGKFDELAHPRNQVEETREKINHV